MKLDAETCVAIEAAITSCHNAARLADSAHDAAEEARKAAGLADERARNAARFADDARRTLEAWLQKARG